MNRSTHCRREVCYLSIFEHQSNALPVYGIVGTLTGTEVGDTITPGFAVGAALGEEGLLLGTELGEVTATGLADKAGADEGEDTATGFDVVAGAATGAFDVTAL